MNRDIDSDFFVLSENEKSKETLKDWLQSRDFNDYEMGKNDKRGNPMIKLLNRTGRKNFTKAGLICCLGDSKDDAIQIIDFHLS